MQNRRGTLESAYRRTTYRAETPEGSLGLRVGLADSGLDRLLDGHSCRTWAFLTAWNPDSTLLATDINQQRQQQLEAEVGRRGWPVYPGAGVSDDGRWPGEPSLLILGIEAAEALQLAAQFGQLAILTGRHGEPAELGWTALARSDMPG
jgi:hypothetical protein